MSSSLNIKSMYQTQEVFTNIFPEKAKLFIGLLHICLRPFLSYFFLKKSGVSEVSFSQLVKWICTFFSRKLENHSLYKGGAASVGKNLTYQTREGEHVLGPILIEQKIPYHKQFSTSHLQKRFAMSSSLWTSETIYVLF